MVTFNHLVDEGRLAAVARNQASRDTNTNGNSTNRPETEASAAASGTATADAASAQTSTNGKEPERIWASSEFWEFTDTLLSQARAAAAAQESSVQGQQKILEACVIVLMHRFDHSFTI